MPALYMYTTQIMCVQAAEDAATWQAWLQQYAQRLSAEPQDTNSRAAARAAAAAVNPVYVLRNWIAQQAIADAEEVSSFRLER
jgi:uncharacterized protein YdiU (UPF0061 family)